MPVPHLTMLELESLRHLIGQERLTVDKLNAYLQECRDPELRSHMENLARQCNHNAQRLMAFLG